MKYRYVYFMFFLLVNYLVGYITPVMFSFHFSDFPVFYFLLRGILLLMAIWCLLVLFYIEVVKNKTIGKLFSNLASVTTVILFFFYLTELFFTFYPESNGVNDTYNAQIWRYYYWRLNKQGFRDIDFQTMDGNGKLSLVFAGDSYTEGHGISNPRERVSDIVRSKLPDYNVYNLGKCGYNIFDETKVIEHMPVVPELVVLQICSNDWDYLIPSKDSSASAVKNDIAEASSTTFLMSKYFISVNYLNSKWKNLSGNIQHDRNEDYDKLYEAFNVRNPSGKIRNSLDAFQYCLINTKLSEDAKQQKLLEIFKPYAPTVDVMLDTLRFNDYLSKLDSLNEYCKRRYVHLLVLPYPEMDKFSMKVLAKYTNRYVCKRLSEHKVDCLDIYPALYNAHLGSYTVNSADNHINPQASKAVADTLLVYLRNHKLIRE